MNAADVLKAARAAGVHLGIDGDDLVLEAASASPGRNPACSPPGPLPGLRWPRDSYDKLLPYGTDRPGHAWLHLRCWEAWHASNRKATAVAVLSLTLGAG